MPCWLSQTFNALSVQWNTETKPAIYFLYHFSFGWATEPFLFSQVLSRRDHHTVILANIFSSSQIESIISAVGFNAVQSISEENYVFEKKCAEIFINLGSVIFYLWSRNADFTLPDYAATLFKVSFLLLFRKCLNRNFIFFLLHVWRKFQKFVTPCCDLDCKNLPLKSIIIW